MAGVEAIGRSQRTEEKITELVMRNPEECLFEGHFLRLAKRGQWEYATRATATGVVAIVALHDDGRVVIIEQYRPPVDAVVLELPAGLVGDTDDSEEQLAAAQRELEEEAGYTARTWDRLTAACSSPGLTDEMVTLFLARGLTRVGEGGGVESESIRVHDMPLASVLSFLAAGACSGKLVDMKLLAGVYAAKALLESE